MTDVVRYAIAGAVVGFLISCGAVSFVAGDESVWDWPTHSRGFAVLCGFFICVMATFCGAMAGGFKND
jgi:hypothetical protein